MQTKTPNQTATQTNVETISDVVALLNSGCCNYFNAHRSTTFERSRMFHRDCFSAHIETRDENGNPLERLCLRVEFYSHSTIIETTLVSDFNAKHDRYERETRRTKTRIENKTGRKPLEAFRNSLWEKTRSYRSTGNVFSFSAFARSGALAVY
jgi:hypothetical protein